jgi:hypothetical protein
MRPLPRASDLLPAVLVVGLALVASASLGACSGSNAQDVLDSNQTASSSGTSGSTSGTSGSGTSGSSGGTSGTSGVVDASVDGSDACPQEAEPNNNKDTANTLSPTLCGVISPNSESDFLTFQLKPTTTSMSINFTGKVLLKIDVNGQTVTLGGSANPKVPFEKGQHYIIEVKATERDNAVAWRVDLVEK